MENVITIAIILVITGLAAAYVYREKKKGKRCIGCPDGGCNGQCSCCSKGER